ncbi:MAG: mucoidy inhibitor MuiA family protein [Halofilum sp. (in: g-proteobacteria)]|nr:mucoidy inhibitor MuiA family protein [Halofilum sp. (in: g-proteobacteria)]
MKRLLALSLLLIANTTALGRVVDSRIDAVTVYPGQLARVDRIARVDLAAGDGALVFEQLPASIESGSIRVAVESGDLRIGAVEVEREPVGESAREREQALREQIEALEASRQSALDRVAAANTQITFIEGLARLPQGEGAAEALTAGEGAANWSALWESIGSGSRAAHERVRAAEREAERLRQEIEVLQRRLQQLGRDREERVRVSVAYGAAAAGEARVRLAYRVSGPRWVPLYQTRLDTSEERLEIVRSARVMQATGEDWTDIRLALSTAQPVRGDRPEPQPWWIDLAPEVRPAAKAESRASADLAAGYAPEQEKAQGGRTINAEFAATYEIAGRVSVPATNQPRELQIAADVLNAEIGAQVFPQQDRRVWLTASATWQGAGPLPSGEVTRFRDGAYVGKGALRTWSPGEERELSFGVDPRVDVAFEPIEDEAGESGWITTQSTLVRRYQLEVTNRHGRVLPLTALFRVPVARNEKITVEELLPSPPARRNVDDRKGVHAWDFTLGAGESKRIELGYRVSYPEGRELSGM